MTVDLSPQDQDSPVDSSRSENRRRPDRANSLIAQLMEPLLPFLLAAGVAAATLALAVSQADPTESAEGRMLALLAAGVMVCASFAARLAGGKWMTGPAAGSMLVVVCLWMLHQGPGRGGAVVMVLVVTLAAGLARSWNHLETGPPESRRSAYLVWTTALTIGLQLLVRPDLFLPARVSAGGAFGRLWLEGILLPAVFGVGLGLLAAAMGRSALLVGIAILLAGPGVDVPRLTILGPALILALGAVGLWRRSGFDARWPVGERLEVLTARCLLLLGAVVVVASSYPWLRPSPWTSARELLTPPRVATVAHARGIVVLSAATPTWHHELAEPVAASEVTVDSSLVHGIRATGKPVATVSAWDSTGSLIARWPLVGGDDTAEWAAARNDLQNLEGFRAPAPWSRWVPPGGGFFANRYRTSFRISGSREFAELEVRLESDGESAPWELHLARLELRR
ncbi:MAG: hypothetical protein MPN21_24310 [Thermoanaerobaculia bacterium]|nr:hypothetical protein [Thermoanaerobaculia bacterium]